MAKGDNNFLSDLNESNLGASKGDGTPSADFEKTFGLEVGRGVYNESGSDALPGFIETDNITKAEKKSEMPKEQKDQTQKKS